MIRIQAWSPNQIHYKLWGFEQCLDNRLTSYICMLILADFNCASDMSTCLYLFSTFITHMGIAYTTKTKTGNTHNRFILITDISLQRHSPGELQTFQCIMLLIFKSRLLAAHCLKACVGCSCFLESCITSLYRSIVTVDTRMFVSNQIEPHNCFPWVILVRSSFCAR